VDGKHGGAGGERRKVKDRGGWDPSVPVRRRWENGYRAGVQGGMERGAVGECRGVRGVPSPVAELGAGQGKPPTYADQLSLHGLLTRMKQ